MKEIKISTEYITLGQFLKYVHIIFSGAMAKDYLGTHNVLVNGEKEDRRGRKLYKGFEICVEKHTYKLV